MLQDFRKFIMRGNVLDLAVAVVIGAAFKVVIDSFVNDIIMKIIGAIVGKPSFADLSVKIRAAHGATAATYITYGAFITAFINFLIVAAALFVIIRSFEALQARRKATGNADEPEALTVEGELLTQIRDLLQGQSAAGAGPAGS